MNVGETSACLELYSRRDVFLLYDIDDVKNADSIIPVLQTEGITYCQRDSNVYGKTVFDDVHEHLLRSTKTVVIISSIWGKEKKLKFLLKSVVKFQRRLENVITVIADHIDISLQKNGLFCLKSTPTIYMKSDSWKTDLIKEIESCIPDFCEVVGTGNTSDSLLRRGLCFQHFRWEIFGLLVSAGEKFLKVDMDEFSCHIDLHHELETIDVCKECSILIDISTKVSLIYDTENPADVFSDLNPDMIKLLLSVFDIKAPVRKSLACVSNGPINALEHEHLSLFFSDAKAAILNAWVGIAPQPITPKYRDYDKRFQSFPLSWSSQNVPTRESMVDAGFYFRGAPDDVECFSCGMGRSSWNRDIDPLQIHLRGGQKCNYLSTKGLTNNSNYPSNIRKRESKIVEEYRNVDDRKLSYSEFDFQDMKTSSKSKSDSGKEELICKLAEAGFYYQDNDKWVKCFCCDTRICYDDDKVDPWDLHLSLSPTCPFITAHSDVKLSKAILAGRYVGGKHQTVMTFMLKRHDGSGSEDLEGYVFSPCGW